MLQRALCESLVGREQELSALEDALLTANRGESRFVLLAGEAGMGKTRLAGELSRRARKLGCEVLWGSCSEAELSLPYLPLVEALGNYLARSDPDELRARLGGAATELGQLFPQLAAGPVAAGDPVQAKLRLFEATVALLAVPAADHGIVLVVEDVHWADASTRELLDHLARRLTGLRALVLCTYRSDELQRRHPLVPTLQSWRRSGLAETVTLEQLTPAGVAEMIADIFDSDEVGDDFRDLMAERTEGNPFVLEEMLREAIERGDVYRTGERWERRSLDDLHIPETVRDTILLRLGRMEPAHVDVLRAGAVLGRSFDYATLAAVAVADDAIVDGALEAALAHQLVEERDDSPGRFHWRHALTQEAIYTDTVLPRRQRIHARAADAIAAADGSAIELVAHLFGAGKGAESVAACLRAADEAEQAVALGQAAGLVERALPHVTDEAEHALLLGRAGRLRWQNSETTAATQMLDEASDRLDALGRRVEAGRFRVVLGRCHWELERPDLALEQYELARDALEPEGPSADLALAYMRIAGLHVFQLESVAGLRAARRAVELAEAAGADFEREWSRSFLALALFEGGAPVEALELMRECFDESLAKGYLQIAWNVMNNEIWVRVHSLAPLDEVLARHDRIPFHPFTRGYDELSLGFAAVVRGELRRALDFGRTAWEIFDPLGHAKGAWRAKVLLAETLTELGRADEALGTLPPVATRTELQDLVYDAPARIHTLLATGSIEEAVELAREIVSHPEVHPYRETLGVAVEAFVAAGLLEEARSVVQAGRGDPTTVGVAGLDEAEGRLLLAGGDVERARPLLEAAAERAREDDYLLLAWRARTLLADALAASGADGRAAELIADIVRETAAAGAVRLRGEAASVAARHGLPVPAVADASETAADEPQLLPAGERFVTTLFADVRDYTQLASASAPEDLADRIGTLQRWAAAEVGRRHGLVDKFAGDAVMATFNVAGARVDHAVHALEAALSLRDKAALLDLPLGIGVAVGPAVVARAVTGANVSVLGVATNLSARLQAAARGGEIVLGDEAYRRVEGWLADRGLQPERELLELKGFAEPQVAYRLRAPAPVG